MISIIWDLDGTLIDSYPFIVSAAKTVSDHYKLGYSTEYIFKFTKDNTVDVFFKKMAKETNVDIDVLIKEFRTDFFKNEAKIKLIDNVKEILEYFKENNIDNYIYTHKGDTTHKVLKNNDVDDYFIEVVTIMYNFKMKPDPEGANYLVNKYSLDKNHTYLIGDRFLDVDCARNANIKSVYYNPLGHTNDNADYNIKDMLELKEIIK